MAETNVNIIDDQLVITVDIESLKYQIENHPMGFRILDDNKFMSYLTENIDTDYKLDIFLDDIAVEAYENGEEFIDTEED